MINYIRSEFYRILHTKDIYLFNLVLMAGVLALNGGIYIAAATLPNIRYAKVQFVLSFLTGSMEFLFAAGAILAVLLFSGERRNGVMKNAVAYGISRTSLFFGKCIVSFVMALASMILLTAVYIISAVLLLEGPAQPYVEQMLEGCGFYRCYQSFIVNLSKVSFIRADGSSKTYAIQFDGYDGEVLLSRDKYPELLTLLKEKYANIDF